MNRRSRGREFIQLNKYDSLLLVTLHLRPPHSIVDIVQNIDEQFLSFTDIYFAYELLVWNRPQQRQRYYEIVMVYFQDHMEISKLFHYIPQCMLIAVQPTTVAQLYQRLSSNSFAVQKELVFQRLKVQMNEVVTKSQNLLTRVICVQRNVLCLSSVENEEIFMSQLKVYIREYQKRHRANLSNQQGLNNFQQISIQKYLYGEHRNTLQIHIPNVQREYMLHIIRERAMWEELIRKDRIVEECSLGEERDLQCLMFNLQIMEDQEQLEQQ